MLPAALRARTTVDLHDLRVAGGLMLAAAGALPLLPGPDGMPCPLRSLTGVPCPLCGMTTSVTAAVHLHLGEALAANPAGIVAVVVGLALLAFHRTRRATVPVWVLPAGLALTWAWELVRFGIL
ncbi:MAG: DUF2752 domain-containing protein [Actinobacteria bacterium]|nr:DUF2752 domain-containing protein [Actinomycetota bacterium]